MKKKICPSCNTELPVDAPHGLCSACVLRSALQSRSPADAPSVEKVQAAFPDFKILECIGRGGMGIVYKAEQAKLGRCVAMKILDPSLSEDPSFAERFEREARTLGKLAHPNIVAIHEFGEREGFFWLTMEFVEGVNLRQAMQASIFTPEQALEVIPELCAALQFAHDQGVLHRDIKPENILLDTRGHVKIADFGIARLVGEQTDFTLTHTGSALGSTAYMAPEQIESPHDVDHRADIYSLGVVFYEMLTGSLPLGRFPAPSEKSTSDPCLDEVVFRALAKERERRYQSAGEVNEGVRTAHQTVAPLEKTPIESAQQFEKWSLLSWIGGIVGTVIGLFTSPLLCGLGATAAVLGLIGCWISLWRIKAGAYRSDHHLALLLLAFWPVVIAISVLSLMLYLRQVDTYPPQHIPNYTTQPFLFFLLTLLVPSLAGAALWKWVGTEGVFLKSRLGLVAACFLVVASALVAKISNKGAGHLRGYDVDGIQFPLSDPDEQEKTLIQAAMKEAAGPFEDQYSIRYLTNPREFVGSGFFAEIEISAASLEIAYQHSHRFRQRLRNLLPEALRPSGSYIPDKGEAIGEVEQRYRLLILPLLVCVPLIVIVTILAPGKRAAALLTFGAVATVAVSQVTWWPHSSLLPPSVGIAPPPPILPPMAYDFSTTRNAMESMIKAAKKGDKEGFSRGLTDEYLEMLLEEDFELRDMMQSVAIVKYGGQQTEQGNDATVRLNGPKRRELIDLVRVNREWKVPKPNEPEYHYSVPVGTIHSMVRAAKADDHYAFERGLDTALFSAKTKEPAKLAALKEQFKRLTGIKQIESESQTPHAALVVASDGDRELRISMILRDAVHVLSSGTPDQETVTIKEWHITKIE